MQSAQGEVEMLVGRLEKLERQNRGMRQGGSTALVLTAALLLMGQAAPKKTPFPKTRTVDANEFVLKNSNGKVGACSSW